MTIFLIVFVAQLFVTAADFVARKYVRARVPLSSSRWVTHYGFLRLSGLLMRLNAVLVMPIGSAATLFAICAVTVSGSVGHRIGERFSLNELIAFALVLAAVLVRAIP